jgi:23S rRNA G2069 N7-methylase RlmK/C1962 C5-methylase RlmI
MTSQADIALFRRRIAEAEAKREAWRLAGNREKYLEAYFEVEGMELLLDRYLRQQAVQGTPS